MLTACPSIYAQLPKPLNIGLIGAGAIVRAAHLPTYRKAGFPVRAIFDINYGRAASLAREFEIPTVCRSMEELLDDRLIEVIDIAVPPSHQPEVALAAIERGKHLLCQKPLAESTKHAKQIVQAASTSGIKLAVNVNMRWEPAIRQSMSCINDGYAGELEAARFAIRYFEHWAAWPWLVSSPRLLFQYDTIHILDLTRKLFGFPDEVRATSFRFSDLSLTGETGGSIELGYKDKRVHIDTDSNVSPSVSPSETEASFEIQASRGTIQGTLGIYYDYPFGRPDTWRLTGSNVFQTMSFAERWIPDAFVGPMAELFSA